MVPVERISRKQYLHQTRPFEGITTNQADYQWNGQPERRQLSTAARKDNGLGDKNLPFEGTTTNRADYQRWGPCARESARPANLRAARMPDNRNFETESRGAYTLKGDARRQSAKPKAGSHLEGLPFDGTTTHQADFQAWKADPQQNYKRSQGYRRRPEDRDFQSDYRGEFTAKPFSVCPAKQVAVSSKPSNGHVCVEACGPPEGKYCLTGTTVLR
jgi:hypothetical protein